MFLPRYFSDFNSIGVGLVENVVSAVCVVGVGKWGFVVSVCQCGRIGITRYFLHDDCL